MRLTRREAGIALALTCLSLGQAAAEAVLEGPVRNEDLMMAISVFTGHAFWRAFQNRVLGPDLVAGIARASGASFEHVYRAFAALCLLAGNFVLFHVLRQLTGSWQRALVVTVIAIGLFVLLCSDGRVYVWDFVAWITAPLFAWFIVTRARLARVGGLFAVDLLNRESALFIPFGVLLLQVFDRGPVAGRIRRALLAVLMLAAGIAWVWFIREQLFLGSIDPRIGQDTGHSLWGEHAVVWQNIEKARTMFVTFARLPAKIAVIAVNAAMLAIAVRAWRTAGPAVAVLGVTMLVSIYGLAVLDELRVYIPLVPFFAVVAVAPRAAS